MLATGPNGAGKTNLLESVHVATQGFSPRTRQDANLVRHGADGFEVRAEGSGESGEIILEVAFRPGEGKRVRINGAAAESLERVRSSAATLVFTPDRLAVVKAGPAVRRAYVDRVIGRLFPASRGAGRRVRRGGWPSGTPRCGEPRPGSPAWTPWSHGTLVSSRRDRRWRPPGRTRSRRSRHPSVSVPGSSAFAGAGLVYDPSPVTAEVLAARFASDLERGLTGAGPHHDEVRVTAGERDLRPHGSQGEQRVALLALLLAEAELLGARRGVPRCSCWTTCSPSSTESAERRSCSESATAPRCSSRRPRAARCPAIPTSCSK